MSQSKGLRDGTRRAHYLAVRWNTGDTDYFSATKKELLDAEPARQMQNGGIIIFNNFAGDVVYLRASEIAGIRWTTKDPRGNPKPPINPTNPLESPEHYDNPLN